MKSLMLLFCLFQLFPAQAAGLEKITIQNLDLNYVAPYGSGEFEKLQIGLSLMNPRYPVEVHRRLGAIALETPFIDFTWHRPLPFLYQMQQVKTRGLSAKGDRDEHFVQADSLHFTPGNTSEVGLLNLDLKCRGRSRELLIQNRIMEDCRNNMFGTIGRVDLPKGVEPPEFLKVLEEFPLEKENPLWAIYLNMEQGEFYGSLWVQSWFNARLHAWGAMHYENNFKTIMIRVDRIRYGYIPVTSIIMRQLQSQVNHPNVKITPPWIRIDLGE
jgi:hypothetical protein